MRLGIFGGSFDPVHYGHLLLAECAREELSLDEVWLIPASVSPFKIGRVQAPGKDRLEMLKLAIGGHDSLVASAVEIDRGDVSYTVDTLEQIARERPGAELFLLMGADSLHDLPNWRSPSRILQLATPAVVRRGGSSEPDFGVLGTLVSAERVEEIEAAQVTMPALELSSTDLRTRAAAGRSLRYRTPHAVDKYIQTHGLYRNLPQR
jgi:nicotinate-nucleotide adenylyltransferase